jgi:L-amino acid N-acyltransferase YncA
MQNYNVYHKSATLTNGKRVVIRYLNGTDRGSITKFFQQASQEDVQFCKEDVKSPEVVDYWLNPENSHRIMALVAEDLETKQIIASLNLYRGQQAALNVGEIQQILVARPFQGLGLGSLLLDHLMDLTTKANLHWLKVEVNTELKNVIKAFLSRGFEIRATFEDYFRDPEGATYDVVLMMRNLLKKEGD